MLTSDVDKGFCIKTKEVGIDQKIFVNICQTDALPPPEDITETELVRLCDSDEPCNFKIPVSIGEIRLESDKKGNDAKTIDVAINSNFFKKIENNLFLRNFLLAVVFESLSDKHHLYVTDERIVLKNRKCYGNLQLHRIQQIQKIDEHVSEGQSNDVLISSDVPSQPKIEIISSSSHEEDESVNIPKYRLFRKVNEPNILYGEFELPYLKNSAGLSLDIGEDRIILDLKVKVYTIIIRPTVTFASKAWVLRQKDTEKLYIEWNGKSVGKYKEDLKKEKCGGIARFY
ncbi:hypothetical protein FQA39_LY16211 [Lamprigera yunnana]|nr:hypothetical protein FQA39_LY16211 [Lamprigera yunnana]